MQEWQDVLVAIDLVELDVKGGEQVQHVVLVEAHLLERPELKLDTLLIELVLKHVQLDTFLKVFQIWHLIDKIVGEVAVELGSFHPHEMILEALIAASFC